MGGQTSLMSERFKRTWGHATDAATTPVPCAPLSNPNPDPSPTPNPYTSTPTYPYPYS